MTKNVRFGVQAGPQNRSDWIETAKRAEDLGFDFLCDGDHAGSHPSPIVSLAAAAAVTTEIKLGTYVLNAGIHDPMDLASDIATLDLLSDGRAVLGLGAGHTPVEWEARGKQRPDVAQRVARLVDVATTTMQLLAGEVVSLDRSGIRLVEAQLADHLQRPVPLLIGGNNRQILRFAAEHAEVIGLTGLGRTLADGHKHELKWSHDQLTESFALARSGTSRDRLPEIQALVQVAKITDDLESVADKMAADFGVPADQVLSSPFVLLGSVSQIVERVHQNAETWGIDSYVVRGSSLDEIGQLIATLG